MVGIIFNMTNRYTVLVIYDFREYDMVIHNFFIIMASMVLCDTYYPWLYVRVNVLNGLDRNDSC